MSAVDPVGAAGFLAHYEGLKDRLPGDPVARARAAEAFRRLGLPGRRDEAWKYTNLRPLTEAAFHEPLSPVADGQRLEAVARLAPARLVFIDGRYRADLSDPPEGGFSVTTLAERPEFGWLAHGEDQPMVALNTMLAEDGMVLDVAEGIDAGAIQLAGLATPAPGHATGFHPRHAIRLGRGARLSLIETVQGEGTYLNNAVFELRLERDARLSVVRLQDESPAAFHFQHQFRRDRRGRAVRQLRAQPGRAAGAVGNPCPPERPRRHRACRSGASFWPGRSTPTSRPSSATRRRAAPRARRSRTCSRAARAGSSRAASRWPARRRRPTATR